MTLPGGPAGLRTSFRCGPRTALLGSFEGPARPRKGAFRTPARSPYTHTSRQQLSLPGRWLTPSVRVSTVQRTMRFRSPARSAKGRVLPGGGKGQMKWSAKAQGGSRVRLRSTGTVPSAAGAGVRRKRKR